MPSPTGSRLETVPKEPVGELVALSATRRGSANEVVEGVDEDAEPAVVKAVESQRDSRELDDVIARAFGGEWPGWSDRPRQEDVLEAVRQVPQLGGGGLVLQPQYQQIADPPARVV